MSTHIAAEAGQIAPDVLMPGDPLRAEWIATNFLTDAVRYSSVRNMYGFTGTYRGRRVSVQGSGMGQPSMAIYASELLKFYDVRRIIRVGSCGAIRPDVQIRDIVLAMTACTDSSMNRLRFEGVDFAPAASWSLLSAAHRAASARTAAAGVHVGSVASWDSFYSDRPELLMRLADYGVLAVEMEASALYTLAAKYGAEALCICTVSDSVVTQVETSAEERERTFGDMVEVALEALATA